MATDKKMIVDCPEEIHSKDSCSENSECEERRSRRKRLLIASLALLAILICIGVAAIAMVSCWTTKVKLQEKEHKTIGNKEVDEELYQDTTDSLTSYHIVDGNTETWFILDYNREIVVLKVIAGDSVGVCYVQPFDPNTASNLDLNSTSTTTPSSQGNEMPSNLSLPVVTLQASNRPIKEKSMLGRQGQELCKDVDTFWILSSSDKSGGSSNNDVRASRVRREQYIAYRCYFNWNGGCSYFTFPDSPNTQYYSCPWICGYVTIFY